MLQVIQSPGTCPEYFLFLLRPQQMPTALQGHTWSCAVPRFTCRLGRAFVGHPFHPKDNDKLLFTHPSMKGIVMSANQFLYIPKQSLPFWCVSRKASKLSLKWAHFGFNVKSHPVTVFQGLGTQGHWGGTHVQPDMSEITAKCQLPFWSQLLYCLLNQEELLLHGLSVGEFESEMLKRKVNPHQSHQTLFSLMFKILIQNLLESKGSSLLTSVGLRSSCECLTNGCYVPFR